MPVDALIARMTLEAQARIAAVRAGADADVRALAEAGAKASARDLEQVLAARQTARERVFAAERAVARRRATAAVLNAQHDFLERIFARAESLAAEASLDARYLDTLPAQIAALQAYLGGRPATLRCRPELAGRIQPLLAGMPQLELGADETAPAGFIALASDGSCTIDGSLAARLAALRPELEADLLAQALT